MKANINFQPLCEILNVLRKVHRVKSDQFSIYDWKILVYTFISLLFKYD